MEAEVKNGEEENGKEGDRMWYLQRCVCVCVPVVNLHLAISPECPLQSG